MINEITNDRFKLKKFCGKRTDLVKMTILQDVQKLMLSTNGITKSTYKTKVEYK